jgi:light-regulated signal transduction histidine kinase (bacteriophytochrome)
MEYSFVNSHILRAPVSRILGLVQLLKRSTSDTHDKDIMNHLEESSKELDEVVRKLSITLQEAREDDKISD